MAQETELQKLEKFVEKLLEKFSALKVQNNKLELELIGKEEELIEKEEQIVKLEGNISSSDTERSEISQRVNKLVEQIEDWEMSLDDVDAESLSSEEVADFAQDEEPLGDEGNEVDDEGRVQHNLFSMSDSKEKTSD